jgi:hypothetical protein
MSIQYYGLASDEELPEEFCAIRHEHGEPSEYHWYVPEQRCETDETGFVTRVEIDGRWYVPERTCTPTKQHVKVSCSQERVTYLCDCGEVLGGYEMNTIPWTHRSDERELPNFCPECGARIEVEE